MEGLLKTDIPSKLSDKLEGKVDDSRKQKSQV